LTRKITEKQSNAFNGKCTKYLESIGAIKIEHQIRIYDWRVISCYGDLDIRIKAEKGDGLYTIFMVVEYPQFVPKEEWMISKHSGKCNIHEPNADEAFDIFKEFIERIKSPVHNENHRLTNV
jgi:hypothetical protein